MAQNYIYKLYAIPFSFRLLWISYAINFLLALAIVAGILLYIEKLKTYIGFLFMLGSFVKFGVFFLYFYPIFKVDDVISSNEFFLFFVPYSMSLIWETLTLTKALNKI